MERAVEKDWMKVRGRGKEGGRERERAGSRTGIRAESTRASSSQHLTQLVFLTLMLWRHEPIWVNSRWARLELENLIGVTQNASLSSGESTCPLQIVLAKKGGQGSASHSSLSVPNIGRESRDARSRPQLTVLSAAIPTKHNSIYIPSPHVKNIWMYIEMLTKEDR